MDSGLEDSPNMFKVMAKRQLYDIMQECPANKLEEKFSFLEKKIITITNCPESDHSQIKRLLSHFKSEFKAKWVAANYIHDRFLKKNEQWLEKTIKFAIWTSNKPGRPTKDFEESSDRSKRRKTKDLRDKVPAGELTFAAQMSQRAEGNIDVSKIIKEITLTPTRGTEFRKAISSSNQNQIKKHTPSEALAIFVEGNFSRRQYEILHAANKSIYPCYSLLKKAKTECYPIEEAIKVTETCAEVTLQELLNHTCIRLCKYLEEVIETCTEEEKANLKFIVKWGCDESQQSQYKQKFENNADSDANIFQSSFVPLRLVCVTDKRQKIIWQNPLPSSPRYCRPIRIRFIHETKDITIDEINYIEDQVKKLKQTEISTGNGMVCITHQLLPTMVDGKVCNAATNTTSTMRCYICGLTSKDFNDLSKKIEVKPGSLKFVLSILHARIRFFESLLHLSYKLTIKKWQIRSAEDKSIVKTRKETIQKAFKEEMGLLVDIPKAGYGNTNDGNTSRRFFTESETASRITGIDLNLIERFKIILEAISSGYK